VLASGLGCYYIVDIVGGNIGEHGLVAFEAI
jgi:hypothetical protein